MGNTGLLVTGAVVILLALSVFLGSKLPYVVRVVLTFVIAATGIISSLWGVLARSEAEDLPVSWALLASVIVLTLVTLIYNRRPVRLHKQHIAELIIEQLSYADIVSINEVKEYVESKLEDRVDVAVLEEVLRVLENELVLSIERR